MALRRPKTGSPPNLMACAFAYILLSHLLVEQCHGRWGWFPDDNREGQMGEHRGIDEGHRRFWFASAAKKGGYQQGTSLVLLMLFGA